MKQLAKDAWFLIYPVGFTWLAYTWMKEGIGTENALLVIVLALVFFSRVLEFVQIKNTDITNQMIDHVNQLIDRYNFDHGLNSRRIIKFFIPGTPPVKDAEEYKKLTPLERLKNDLKKAELEEDFDLAAVIKKQIDVLEKGGKK